MGLTLPSPPSPLHPPYPPWKGGEREKEMGVRAISIISFLFEMTISWINSNIADCQLYEKWEKNCLHDAVGLDLT